MRTPAPRTPRHAAAALAAVATLAALCSVAAAADPGPPAPPAPPAPQQLVAVQLDTAAWPAHAAARESLARAAAARLGLAYVRAAPALDGHFLFALQAAAEPRGAEPRDDSSTPDNDSAAAAATDPDAAGDGAGDGHAHLHRRLADNADVLWYELQVPRARLFKRDGLASPLLARSPLSPAPDPLADPSPAQEDARAPPMRISEIAGRLGILDPRFRDQWHLFNPTEPGHDINVTGVWLQGISGKGVTVAFIDDGLDHANPDLRDNYSAEGSYDFNFHKKDPSPSLDDDTHGTRCAGEVAAVKNDVCGVGVAWSAKVAGIRVLSGELTNFDEAAAINYAFNTTQIYSCSWGPRDDGRTMEAPPEIVTRAVKNGIDHGRDGLGSIFVFAAGNGGNRDDNCNFDGYTNSIYTITVAAADRYENHPGFSEQCSANLISMWSGQGSFSGIVTTDWRAGCTDRHGGTSAAAPLAAGIYALVLSVRPDLHWRDVQRLTIETAYPINTHDSDWQRTAAGRVYSHKYGYGTLDAFKIVEAAKTFASLNPQAVLRAPVLHVNKSIPAEDGEGISDTFVVTKDMLDAARFLRLEHITVTVNIEHERRGDISISLVSPANVTSRLIEGRRFDDDALGFKNWTMMTVMHWDENAQGAWRLNVIDNKNPDSEGTWIDWQIVFWGESTGKPTDKPTDKPAAQPRTSSSLAPATSATPQAPSTLAQSQHLSSPTPSPTSASAQHDISSGSNGDDATKGSVGDNAAVPTHPSDDDTILPPAVFWGAVALLTGLVGIVCGGYILGRCGYLRFASYRPLGKPGDAEADDIEFGLLARETDSLATGEPAMRQTLFSHADAAGYDDDDDIAAGARRGASAQSSSAADPSAARLLSGSGAP
ncbi:pheromone processing endoprotease [Polyrhizophydium stewartii]|uniref:Pheromone processing endoprotease n=1 Tax=Polyrhizophydium stewartii TaxID=2732419 RepID=A0ABR4NAD6_9FUNG